MKKIELVGISEFAAAAGVTRQLIVTWRTRYPNFPSPYAQLICGPIWRRADAIKWLRHRADSKLDKKKRKIERLTRQLAKLKDEKK